MPFMLNDYLKQCLVFSPLYGVEGKLFTHLPMALQALDRMGADERRLRDFMHAASKQLKVKTPWEPVEMSEWRRHLGQTAYYAGYEVFFAEWIRREGLEAVLLQAMPVLLPGVGSAAFHALIRLAYALESEFEAEIAAALASWAVTFEPLHTTAATRPALSTMTSLSQIMQACRQSVDLVMPELTQSFIVDRMRAASALDGFGELAAAAEAVQPSLRDIAECSLAIYRNNYNFTALHMVTATHAARVLSEKLPSIMPLLMQHLLPAWLAAWVSIKRPAVNLVLAHEKSQEAASWPALIACANQAEDVHDIKLSYSAWREYQHYGFEGYALACAQVLREQVC
jgi:hypothetical protein